MQSDGPSDRTGQTPPDGELTRVGAPLITPTPPDRSAPEGRFDAWLGHRHEFVVDLLDRLSTRWNPYGSFIEIHFDDEEWGRCGAVVTVVGRADSTGRRARERLIFAIPLSEMTPLLPRWENGDTVLIHVDDMPEPLARRYHATRIHWSLDVPVFIEGEWVGLVGAATGRRGVSPEMEASYESSARLLMSEYAADAAFDRFRHDMSRPGLLSLWGSEESHEGDDQRSNRRRKDRW